MANPIDELQRAIADPQVSVVSVLHQAMPLAKKLGDDDFVNWASGELNGYAEEDSTCSYRNLKGQYVVLSLDGRPIPIHWGDKDAEMNSRFITLPLAETESLLAGGGDTFAVKINVDPSTLSLDVEPGDTIGFSISRATISGFLGAVRQRVLEWAMNQTQNTPIRGANDAVAPITVSAATVFYSWQSDLPNRTNRGFIEDCLERAIKELRADDELRVDPALDRDTKDVPGSPDIAATIFDKIESCGLFVCDVSIINMGTTGRPTPNPNVLIELGFAVKSLGWSRVICVFNEATGSISDLPFDLRQRRVRPYRLEDGQDKAETRKRLTGMLKADVRAAFAFLEAETAASSGEMETSTSRPRTPALEVLDATIECQPPIAQPSHEHIHHVRPEYIAGRLVWSIAASLYLDARPGEQLSVALHRCGAWMDDRCSGKRIPITDLKIHSDSKSQVCVDDAVLSIRGPGRFSIEGSCETPFRESGYPDAVTIDLILPVSELDGAAIETNFELHESHQGDGWPLRWKNREES